MGQPSHTCFLKLDTFGHSAPTQAELAIFRLLIFDPTPEFIGGPCVAIDTVGKLGTNASRMMLREALTFWEESDHPEAEHVRGAILQALQLDDKSADLRTILERAGRDRWINAELPNVAAEYARRAPEEATDLFADALHSYRQDIVYAGTLAWAVLRILPQIVLRDSVLNAAIELAQLPACDRDFSAGAPTSAR